MAIVLLLLGLLLPAAAAAKPRHHHKCKRSQATVKINGKRRCKPINAVFPKPRVGDERIAAWTTVLNPPRGLRDRRGRKLLSLLRGQGSAGRKLYAALAATMPEGFARLDALDEPSMRPHAARATSTSGCGGSRIPRDETFVERSVAGVTVSGVEHSSPNGKSLIFRAKLGDKFVRTSVEDSSCGSEPLPECPTAEGVLRSKSSRSERIAFLLFDDGDLVGSTIVTTETRVSDRGRTAEDARLDFIDIDYSVNTTVNSGPASAMSTHRFTDRRKVLVNMRTRPESYAPGSASLSSGGAAKLDDIDEKRFATAVGNLITAYRSRETGAGFADKPGKCAELKFSPASDTLKLRKGQTGKVKVRVESNGTAGNPRATAAKSVVDLTGNANANLTPSSAKGDVIPFDYKVTRAGRGIKVTAGFAATSTAGLAASAIWTQPTDQTVQRITGTFSGSEDEIFAGPLLHQTKFRWTGTVTYKRDDTDESGPAGSYTVESGEVNVTASGSTAQGCTLAGSVRADLGPNFGSGTVTGRGAAGGSPFAYALAAFPADSSGHGAGEVVVTLSGCTSFPELNGTTMTDMVPGVILDTGYGADASISADGLQYEGSRSVPGGASWTWSLHRETS